MRSIGDAVIACDARGSVLFMNGVAESLTGWTQQEAIKRPLKEVFRIVDEATRETVESPVEKVQREGKVVGLANHTLLLRRDGSEIAIDDSGAPIHDEAGNLTGVVLIFRDITSRRRAERNLELLSDSGRALVESSDLQSTLERIAELCIHSFSDFCYFDLLEPEGTVHRTIRRHRDPAQQALLDEASQASLTENDRHPVARTIQTGNPTLIENVTDSWLQSVALDENHLRCIRDLKFHTLLSVPIRGGDQRLGALSFCRTTNPTAFDEGDCKVAQELADRVGANLVDILLYRSTREAQEIARLERQKLRDLFLQAPVPILMMNGPELLITLANDLYVRILRRKTVEDVVGKILRTVLPELEGQGFFELLDEVYRSGIAYFGKEMLAHIENVTTGQLDDAYFNFVYQPTRNPTGEVDGILVVALEVTDQVRARRESEAREALLKRQTLELEAIYQTAPIGLALFDPVEFRYLRLNDRQAELVGLSAPEILGKAVNEIAPIEGLREMFQRVAEGVPLRDALLEGELPTTPGVHRSWTVNYSPVYGEDNKVRAITAASLEITAQRRAEDALIQSEKIAAVGRLASSIAHEINNPLESVTNLLYLARNSDEPAAIQKYLDDADRELRRISLITSQTLRFYRQSTRPAGVQCEGLIEGVLSLYQGRLLNSSVRVETRAWVQRPVVCFEGEIRQVIGNLVGNALDAMPHGGRLLIRSREGRDWKSGQKRLVLTFADTGMGIPTEARNRIFEPFFTTKGEHGTGLGLWISKEIIEKHSGALRMRSSQRYGASGTVFTLSLPFDSTTSP